MAFINFGSIQQPYYIHGIGLYHGEFGEFNYLFIVRAYLPFYSDRKVKTVIPSLPDCYPGRSATTPSLTPKVCSARWANHSNRVLKRSLFRFSLRAPRRGVARRCQWSPIQTLRSSKAIPTNSRRRVGERVVVLMRA